MKEGIILVNKKITFPKDFFTKERPTITTKKALKDIIPINLENIVLSKKNIKKQ